MGAKRLEVPQIADVNDLVTLVASPMKFSGTPLQHDMPPPVVGQHTDEILRGVLKKTDAEIAALKASGAV